MGWKIPKSTTLGMTFWLDTDIKNSGKNRYNIDYLLFFIFNFSLVRLFS